MIRLVVLALASALGAGRVAQDLGWDEAWMRLSAAAELPAGEERESALAPLRELAEARAATPRGRLLSAWLARVEGSEGTAFLRPAELEDLSLRETWLAARVLVPGPALDRALARSVADLEGTELQACYRLAFDRFVALADGFELDAAIALARAVHERVGAPWSASNLASSLRRAGRSDEAWAVHTEMLGRPLERDERAALLQERALVAAGAGWRGRERADLGAALARGSGDAAQVLGRLALAEGRFETARALFRSVLRDDPPRPWALRGWGLSMLPRARSRL